jgi:hypothetical protein
MSLKNTLGGIGKGLLALLVLLGVVFLVLVFLLGAVALSAIMTPILKAIFGVTALVSIALFVPATFFASSRDWGAVGAYVASHVLGFCLWMFSVLLLYTFGNLFWVLVGVLLGGVGVIPLALIFTALASQGELFVQLLIAGILTYGLRAIALNAAAKVN